MAGITLPPLKWLLAGAIVAGAWAYHQDVPARHDTRRAASERSAPKDKTRMRLLVRVALPASRPSVRKRDEDRLATGAIKKPVPRPPAAITPNTSLVPKHRAENTVRHQSTATLTAAGKGVPLRPPQPGDCECPYDLMINGSTCGDRSALSRGRVSRKACYR